ncbi:hypothetical protein OC846_005787 [Tilletia horrida]|uniref:Uncharacterized protein n=1 Tax=Tilletia horrida TaxID=155126 RepID=A0AAN6GMB9_9BASI|nr:hypothetical protein OC846_005787 [Tilletia horrida]KAK0563419.1 hypothetical protein OC861_004816 [Tilletia horrida]
MTSSQKHDTALWAFQLVLSLADIGLAALLAVWIIDLPALDALNRALRLRSIASADISGLTALGALHILWILVQAALVAFSTVCFFCKPSFKAAEQPCLGSITFCHLALGVLGALLVGRVAAGIVAVCEVLQISALATSAGLQSPFSFQHRLAIALVWGLSLFVSLWTLLAQVVWLRNQLDAQQPVDGDTSKLVEKEAFDIEEPLKVDSRDRTVIPEGYLSARRRAAAEENARIPPPAYSDVVKS